MRPINYYVAISIDGFIAGPDEDISGFTQESDIVKKYQEDLLNFDTVIMGKNTYEFGYKFGMQPGMLAYPHMEHYIFSNHLKIENPDNKLHVEKIDLEKIKALKNQKGSEIYLCGGGIFASWLLENEMIEKLTIKLNPFIQGSGIKLFSNTKKLYQLNLLKQEAYSQGLQMLRYEIQY